MEKKKWNTPDLTVYGDVATLTQAGQGCVIKVLGINDDFVQNTDNAGSTAPCP